MKRRRGAARLRKERPNSQGGGKYSRAAPKVRHKRARAKAKAAREARKDNRA